MTNQLITLSQLDDFSGWLSITDFLEVGWPDWRAVAV